MKNFKQIDEVWATSMQERQLAACAPLMAEETLIPMSIVYEEEPLEKSRLRLADVSQGDLVEVLHWRERMGFLVKTGLDADGKAFLEY